ncbi:hypothetical protein E2320_019801, partial [Naja naja]
MSDSSPANGEGKDPEIELFVKFEGSSLTIILNTEMSNRTLQTADVNGKN